MTKRFKKLNLNEKKFFIKQKELEMEHLEFYKMKKALETNHNEDDFSISSSASSVNEYKNKKSNHKHKGSHLKTLGEDEDALFFSNPALGKGSHVNRHSMGELHV